MTVTMPKWRQFVISRLTTWHNINKPDVSIISHSCFCDRWFEMITITQCYKLFLPHTYLAPQWEDPLEFHQHLWWKSYRVHCFCNATFTCFERTRTCDRQTDKQTNTGPQHILHYHSIIKKSKQCTAVSNILASPLWETPMPYGITQCYLPSGSGENPAFTPSRITYVKADQLETEPVTCRSQVQRPTTQPPPCAVINAA